MAINAVQSKPSQLASLGMPVYISAALVLMAGALIYFIGFTSQGQIAEVPLTPEAKEYVRSLQLSDVEMKAGQSYFHQVVVEIAGKIANAGTRNLDRVEIYCIFHDAYGQVVLRKRLPIVSARQGGLKPGQMKSFRLPFDEIPDSWNHTMPSLVIAAIKFS